MPSRRASKNTKIPKKSNSHRKDNCAGANFEQFFKPHFAQGFFFNSGENPSQFAHEFTSRFIEGARLIYITPSPLEELFMAITHALIDDENLPQKKIKSRKSNYYENKKGEYCKYNKSSPELPEHVFLNTKSIEDLEIILNKLIDQHFLITILGGLSFPENTLSFKK